MRKSAAPPHLRLISAESGGQEKPQQYLCSQDKQLSFPYPETSTVFLLHVDSIGKIEFARILGDCAPRWIIDVRAVPRLDTIAASRLSAFTLFERSKASYIDLFGRLGIKSYCVAESNPGYWSSAINELLKNAERRGPYLFLFDNEQLLRIADEILPEAIQPIVGKAVRFAHIRHSDEKRDPPRK